MGEGMKVVIPGELPSFNEIVDAAKSHYHAYNNMKRDNTELVAWHSKKVGEKAKVYLDITWYCKDKRKDPDNIAAGVKFIFDGLVEAGVIKNDGWNENAGWSNSFKIDKENPRVEVIITEVKE